MSECAEQFDSFPVISAGRFFFVRIGSEVNVPVIKSNARSPRSRAASGHGIHSLKSAYVPSESLVSRVALSIAFAQVSLPAIQSVVIFVIHDYRGIRDPKDHPVQQDRSSITMRCRPPESTRTGVKGVSGLTPARKPFERTQGRKILGIDNCILPLIQGQVAHRGIVRDRHRNLVNGNGLSAAAADSVGDNVLRGHARSNQRVGFVRCLQHLTPKVYQWGCQ